jgi:hypothetical protein
MIFYYVCRKKLENYIEWNMNEMRMLTVFIRKEDGDDYVMYVHVISYVAHAWPMTIPM